MNNSVSSDSNLLNSVSGIVLTRDEGYNLVDCIKSIKGYVSEIIVLDGSILGRSLDSQIANDLGCIVHRVKGIDNIGWLRNFGQSLAKNDWCLHVDVDELFSNTFLENIRNVIAGKHGNAYIFSFPRINLPFYERFPDYQNRLVNKRYTSWKGNIHELVSSDSEKEIIRLDNFPIVHKKRDNKIESNIRWNTLRKKKILVVSLFKDCKKFIDEFFLCLEKMIEFDKTKLEYNSLFLEGNSEDNTLEKLFSWMKRMNIREKNENRYRVIKMDINKKISRFERLALLRNMALKIGLEKDYDYVLMIDSDIAFEKDLVSRMINDIEKEKSISIDVVAPMVFIRDFREFGNNYFYDPLAYVGDKGNNFDHFYPYIDGFNDDNNNTNFINVNSVGSCYLMKGSVFNLNDLKDFDILKCYKESEKKIIVMYDGFNDVSEQVGFFKLVKKAGYNVAVDKTLSVYHINLEKIGLGWH